ncbi:MAG TPA: hypothetical protein VN380_09810 [Thermoanaerobaculia bacterium]|nr:hypothetical protein [Thermoanaerobaculia bacterium]
MGTEPLRTSAIVRPISSCRGDRGHAAAEFVATGALALRLRRRARTMIKRRSWPSLGQPAPPAVPA